LSASRPVVSLRSTTDRVGGGVTPAVPPHHRTYALTYPAVLGGLQLLVLTRQVHQTQSPSVDQSRPVLIPMPWAVATPRASQLRLRLRRECRGADPLLATRRETVGRVCLAVALRPSNRLRLLLGPLSSALHRRSRLGLSVISAFRHWSASIASPTTRLLWPLLTSPPRPTVFPRVVARDLPSRQRRSPRVRDVCLAGFPPDLLPRVRMSIGLCDLALAHPTRQPFIRFLYVDTPDRGGGFLQIPPRDGHPCLPLRFRS